MKSLTIHGLEDQLYKKIKQNAQLKGLSLSKTIKILLRKALGMSDDLETRNRNEFIEFLGVWSQEEAREFENNIQDIESVDSSDWQ